MKLSNVLSGAINATVVTAVLGLTAAYADKANAFIESFSKEDRHCMQQNIYFEARNESLIGQASVAWVTLNRVSSKSFPNTICDVVWQNKQFSWTHDGKSDKPKEMEAWKRAGQVVDMVLDDYAWNRKDPTFGATHYHADYVNPYWTAALNKTKQIGTHIFYK